MLNKEKAEQIETKTIGVIVTYISECIFPDILRGIEKRD